MAERRPREVAAELSDEALIAAMRRDDRAALAELYRRYAPLLRRRAASWCAGAAERDELVSDVLGDVAIALMRPTAAVPRSLAAYLLVALRHRAARARQVAARRLRDECDAAVSDVTYARATPASRPRRVAEPVLAVVHAGVSAHARHAASGTHAEPAPLDPALARLAAHLDGLLREPDRLLLAWLADHVPMRLVAEWLGIGYDAALKRASRLRARLRAAAVAYIATLPAGEQRAVHQFLGRALGDDAGATPSAENAP